MSSERLRITAVVLAGGASRRFGADKLNSDLAGRSMLDHAVAGLPAGWPVIIVGPSRPLSRSVTFVTEDPPGSGPGAALVAGFRAAAAGGAEVVVTLPGDAPDGGRAAELLVNDLVRSDAPACVGQDAGGRDQPLQLAVRGAALVALAAATDTANLPARVLLSLVPGLRRVPLPEAQVRDLDTPEQAAAWLAEQI